MMRHARSFVRGHGNTNPVTVFAALALLGLLLMPSDAPADEKDDILAALTVNAKIIVKETNNAFGGGLEGVCTAGRSKVNPKVKLITKELVKQKVLVGSSGFFQLEVENYYARVCGKRFRR